MPDNQPPQSSIILYRTEDGRKGELSREATIWKFRIIASDITQCLNLVIIETAL
jgi:hypothetical protein